MKSEIRLLEYESLVYHLLGLYPRNGYTFYNFSTQINASSEFCLSVFTLTALFAAHSLS